MSVWLGETKLYVDHGGSQGTSLPFSKAELYVKIKGSKLPFWGKENLLGSLIKEAHMNHQWLVAWSQNLPGREIQQGPDGTKMRMNADAGLVTVLDTH